MYENSKAFLTLSGFRSLTGVLDVGRPSHPGRHHDVRFHHVPPGNACSGVFLPNEGVGRNVLTKIGTFKATEVINPLLCAMYPSKHNGHRRKFICCICQVAYHRGSSSWSCISSAFPQQAHVVVVTAVRSMPGCCRKAFLSSGLDGHQARELGNGRSGV